MSTNTIRPPAENPQETIRMLQEELAETNREVLLLTVELDKRVEARTAQLTAAQEELQQKNAQLVQRTEQLETANKELEAFAYSVSHDLRAPLRWIDGFVQVILADHGSALDGEVRQYLDRISAATAEMSRLIQDLLAFSRMGRAAMHPIEFNMDQLLQEALQELAADTQGRHLQWNIAPLPIIHGDPALLKQVWLNLLSNAIKYTRPRNPARIDIGCLRTGQVWEFYVRDNGVGFDMQYVDKLFGVFQRLHGSAEFEGTGIGLASVHRIVKRHGGRTWAEGEVDKGATVHFTLPA